jgi:hypothetical protein
VRARGHDGEVVLAGKCAEVPTQGRQLFSGISEVGRRWRADLHLRLQHLALHVIVRKMLAAGGEELLQARPGGVAFCGIVDEVFLLDAEPELAGHVVSPVVLVLAARYRTLSRTGSGARRCPACLVGVGAWRSALSR